MTADGIVHLVEDDEAVRDAISLVLRAADFTVHDYDSAEAFLARYQPAAEPECLVLDVRLPRMSGIDLQETLAARQRDIPIVMITGHGDVPLATRALKAGAVDFLQKPVDDESLLAGIAAALAKARARREETSRAEVIHGCFRQLSRREREVMFLVVGGASNKVIAARLGISPRTVEIYRRRVMEKMRARTLPDLVRMVLSSNLTP